MRRITLTITNCSGVNIGGIFYAYRVAPYVLTVDDTQYDALAVLAAANKITLANNSTNVLPINATDATTTMVLANRIKANLLSDGFARSLVEMAADTEYTAPVAGTLVGKTKIATLTLPTGAGATKWMYKVQAGAFTTPVLDTAYTGSTNYTAGANITAAPTNHLLLLATDADGKVKGFSDITLDTDQVAPLLELATPANYSAPEAGAVGKTKIATLTLPATSGATKWMTKIQAGAFVAPVLDTAYADSTDYTAGTELDITATNHLLLLATDADGKVKAYVDLTVAADAIGA